MSRFFTPALSALEPYTPGEQPRQRLVKLNTNESPYPPSPMVQKAITAEAIDRLRLYSDPACTDLVSAIAAHYRLDPSCVMAGNGSDEVLAIAIRAFCGPDTPLAFADITYGFYPVWAALFGIRTKVIPLRDDFSLSPADYCGIGCTAVIANPNAPTGLALTPPQIETILRANPDNVLIVDEAYVDFGAESCRCLLDRYDNLLVVQTFSKSRSLAGGRVGFALGHPSLIADLNRVRFSLNPYNLNSLSLLAGAASMRDEEYFSACCARIRATREKTAAALVQRGCTVTDSMANFLFVRPNRMPGRELFARLRENGILVRRWDAPRIADWLRITVGSEEEMQTLLDTIDRIWKED